MQLSGHTSAHLPHRAHFARNASSCSAPGGLSLGDALPLLTPKTKPSSPAPAAILINVRLSIVILPQTFPILLIATQMAAIITIIIAVIIIV
jgi:hypothetical protein